MPVDVDGQVAQAALLGRPPVEEFDRFSESPLFVVSITTLVGCVELVS